MNSTKGFFISSFILFSLFKVMFLNSYRSTDFEVHRNWLAITNSLPIKDWYYEETSEWTLDYPPYFAYFEYLLSKVASAVDLNMLNTKNLNYASRETVIFQKMTVILADTLLAFSIYKCAEAIKLFLPGRFPRNNLTTVLFVLIFMNAGLFIVDHIHFQYNGFLYGVLLLSISNIIKENYFTGAFLFAVLLNLKHIFLYMAPSFGVYLFAKCCLNLKESVSTRFKNFLKLSFIVIAVFITSFGPFYKHIPQIITRLFPFKRGLSHAYWAPNIWAIYNSLDLALGLGKRKSGLTGGLVGVNQLAILPQIEALHTLILTLTFMMPIIWKLFRSPTPLKFIEGVILTAWTSYMFGYHVHEKAILNVIVPFGLLGLFEPHLFILTLLPATVSLFPLLFTPFEIVHRFLLASAHLFLTLTVIRRPKYNLIEFMYLVGLIPMSFIEILTGLVFPTLPFLPLIIISDYTFIGIFYAYVKFYYKSVTQ